jgi:hypothetical protein
MVQDVNPTLLNHSYKVHSGNKSFFDKQIGKRVSYKTIKDAFDGYVWNKQDYNFNKTRLNEITTNLQAAKTPDDLYQACLDCLEWGAGSKKFKLYTANRDWLVIKKTQGNFSSFLDDSYKQLSSSQPNLEGFIKENIQYRMNAGFTKIYALKYKCFIIYDSRVAAALGLLVRRYCQENELNQVPANIAFNWSNPKKRNPSLNNYQFSSLNNDSKKHAKWNVKANWVLNAVVAEVARTATNKEVPFWGVPANESLRALEASLFMVGYSVIPCAGIENPENIQSSPSAIEATLQVTMDEEDYDETSEPTLKFLWDHRIRQGRMNNNRLSGGWVPMTHNFTTALDHYLSYRLDPAQPIPPTSADFETFMQNQNIAIGIAQNKGVNEKLYVQNGNEFNLNNEDILLIQSLWASQSPNGITRDALAFLNQYRQRIINSLATQSPEDIWNNFPKYLMDTYLCGQLVGYTNNQKINILEGYRYAGIGNGKGNTTNAILTVGRSFGTHFGFLDENYLPTDLYRYFFLKTSPLANWIDKATTIQGDGETQPEEITGGDSNDEDQLNDKVSKASNIWYKLIFERNLWASWSFPPDKQHLSIVIFNPNESVSLFKNSMEIELTQDQAGSILQLMKKIIHNPASAKTQLQNSAFERHVGHSNPIIIKLEKFHNVELNNGELVFKFKSDALIIKNGLLGEINNLLG